jgi:hypothetical protein
MRRNLQCSFKAPLGLYSRHSEQRNYQAPISPLPRPGKYPVDILRSLTIDRPGSCHQYSTQRFVSHDVAEVEDVEAASISLISAVLEFAPRMSASDRELLQHFETSTSQKLALSKTMWRTKVLRDAFQVRLLSYISYQWLIDPVQLCDECCTSRCGSSHQFQYTRRPFWT